MLIQKTELKYIQEFYKGVWLGFLVMVYYKLWLGVLAGLPFLLSKDLCLKFAEIYSQMCHDCYLSYTKTFTKFYTIIPT